MARSSIDVVQELLDEMDRLVVDYPPGVKRTGRTVKELIDGTACFPGGTGLWRGDMYGGPLPEYFPERSVMFIGHNFDSIAKYDEAIKNKGEIETAFWISMKEFLRTAGPHDPADCFFTNVLMGLKPGKASGRFPPGRKFRKQCRSFLAKQIEIAKPRRIVLLGGPAEEQFLQLQSSQAGGDAVGYRRVDHPSAFWWTMSNPNQDRWQDQGQWQAAQGEKIKKIVTLANQARGRRT